MPSDTRGGLVDIYYLGEKLITGFICVNNGHPIGNTEGGWLLLIPANGTLNTWFKHALVVVKDGRV